MNKVALNRLADGICKTAGDSAYYPQHPFFNEQVFPNWGIPKYPGSDPAGRKAWENAGYEIQKHLSANGFHKRNMQSALYGDYIPRPGMDPGASYVSDMTSVNPQAYRVGDYLHKWFASGPSAIAAKSPVVKNPAAYVLNRPPVPEL